MHVQIWQLSSQLLTHPQLQRPRRLSQQLTACSTAGAMPQAQPSAPCSAPVGPGAVRAARLQLPPPIFSLPSRLQIHNDNSEAHSVDTSLLHREVRYHPEELYSTVS